MKLNWHLVVRKLRLGEVHGTERRMATLCPCFVHHLLSFLLLAKSHLFTRVLRSHTVHFLQEKPRFDKSLTPNTEVNIRSINPLPNISSYSDKHNRHHSLATGPITFQIKRLKRGKIKQFA